MIRAMVIPVFPPISLPTKIKRTVRIAKNKKVLKTFDLNLPLLKLANFI
jgi:hypothetical protein